MRKPGNVRPKNENTFKKSVEQHLSERMFWLHKRNLVPKCCWLADIWRADFCLLWEDNRSYPLHWTGPVPPSFMMNAPLARAEPIRDMGNISMITYLRKGEKWCTAVSGRDDWEDMSETSLQTPRSVEKQREEVLQVQEQPVMPVMVSQVISLQPWGSQWIRYPPAHLLEHAGVPQTKLQPMDIPHRCRLLAGAAVCGEETTLMQVFWQDLGACEGTHTEAAHS